MCRLQGSHKGLHQTGEMGGPLGEACWYPCPGHCARPDGWILLSLWIPCGCPRTLGRERVQGPSLPPHLLPGQVMEGLVSRQRPLGKHVESRVRTQLWPAELQDVFWASLRPFFSVLRGPKKPPPACSCGQCDLSSREPQWGGHSSEDTLSPVLPSSWRKEGKRGTAWRTLGREEGHAPELRIEQARARAWKLVSPGFKSCLGYSGAA